MHRRFRFLIILLIIGVTTIGSISIMKWLDKPDLDPVDITSDIEEEEPDIEVEAGVFKHTIDNLNLRTGPGTDQEVIFTIPKGEKVEVLGHDNGWDRIIYNNVTGYSSSEYLSDFVEDTNNNDDDLEIIVSPETMKVVKGILLVNKEYALPMGYDPGEDPEAREYLDKMFAAHFEETGNSLTAYSGYRTYEYQKGLFNRYVEKDGYDNALMYSAKPRHSEHESGLAYDIGGSDQSYWLEEEFEDTEEGIWLRDNAHRFGFILRYPKGKTHITGYIYEPWHFRYVGIGHATNIYEEDITLEEYLLEDI
ncbi:MAG: SH3 domain-containing protein [Tissierella sp.]|nr:SH3 domain-containing protein [Tissierella sp.]